MPLLLLLLLQRLRLILLLRAALCRSWSAAPAPPLRHGRIWLRPCFARSPAAETHASTKHTHTRETITVAHLAVSQTEDDFVGPVLGPHEAGHRARLRELVADRLLLRARVRVNQAAGRHNTRTRACEPELHWRLALCRHGTWQRGSVQGAAWAARPSARCPERPDWQPCRSWRLLPESNSIPRASKRRRCRSEPLLRGCTACCAGTCDGAACCLCTAAPL
jgi:hypothetical protein